MVPNLTVVANFSTLNLLGPKRTLLLYLPHEKQVSGCLNFLTVCWKLRITSKKIANTLFLTDDIPSLRLEKFTQLSKRAAIYPTLNGWHKCACLYNSSVYRVPKYALSTWGLTKSEIGAEFAHIVFETSGVYKDDGYDFCFIATIFLNTKFTRKNKRKAHYMGT